MTLASRPSAPRRALRRALVVLPLLVLLPDLAKAACFPHAPLASLLVTSNFGIRKHPKLNVTRIHAGIDFAAAKFTKVFAVQGGMVQISTYAPGAGNYVQILGTDGKTTRYLHHERNHVKAGDTVAAGQQIADSGATGGVSTGPHLHFEVKPNGVQAVDPRPYLCPSPSERPGAGPDPTLNAGAPPPAPGTSAPSTVTNGVPNNNYPPMGATPTAAVAVPQASGMPNYQGMSTQEFLARESSRRFTNPQWMRDIQDPLDALRAHPDPAISGAAATMAVGDMKPMLWREIIFMMNLDHFYDVEKRDRRERIEQMLATDLAERTRDYSERVLDKLRRSALGTSR